MPELHHLALRVADPARAAAFYGGVLGLPELRRTEGPSGLIAVWLQAGAAVLMLERRLRGTGPAEGSGHLLVLHTGDLKAAEQDLARAGVAVEDRTEHTLYFRDPDGHRVGFSDYPFFPRG